MTRKALRVQSRWLAIFLVALLAMSVAVPGQGLAAKSEEVYRAATIPDLKPHGENLSAAAAKNSKIAIDDAGIRDESVHLSGSVDTGATVTRFELFGTLAASEVTSTRLIGRFEDAAGNYDVILVSVDSDPSKSFLTLNRALPQATGSLVKIYLMRKGSREFTIFEAINPDFLEKWKLSPGGSGFTGYQMGEHGDEYWYAKVLLPTKKEAFEKPADKGDVSIQAMTTATSDWNYRYTYTVMGALVYEDFTVRHYMAGPDAITSQGQWFTELRVLSERTWSYDDPSMNSDNTNTKIGLYAPSETHFVSSPGDAFNSARWDSSYSTYGSINITVAWNVTDPYTGLGFAVSYTDGRSFTNDSFINFDNTNRTALVRQEKVQFAKGMTLRDKDQRFDVNLDVGHYSTPGSKEMKVKFVYDISNGLDYSWGGQQVKTLTLPYLSQG